jgi:hypothetical protein
VVAQPYKRGARVGAPGKVDATLGEFWVDNPWDISSMGRNLSNHERQRFFLNYQGKGFFDLSFLSGADAEGDGRAVVAADFRNSGQLDLVVRKCGGGPLTVYQNQLPPRNYLEVSLRGRQSNRLGIGSRLFVEAGGQKQVRELYPINSFSSQMPARAHFGLGDAKKIDRLTIRWPSGQVQVLSNLSANRHIVVEEGKDASSAVETVMPGTVFLP